MRVIMACALVGAGLSGAVPASAAAATGLACLRGSWTSNRLQSGAASGLGGIRLTVSVHGSSASSVADYDYSSALVIGVFDFYIRGSSHGTFTFNHGAYRYQQGASTEKVSIFLASKQVAAPKPVARSAQARYDNLRCSATSLVSTTTVPTKTGTITATAVYHRG